MGCSEAAEQERGETNMVLLRLVVLAMVARAYSGPVSYTSETCATTCEANNHNFEPGQTYDYDLQTTISTSIPGGTEDQSSLQLTALAHIDALSPCELALRLRQVVLLEGEAAVGRLPYMKQELEQNTLRFSLSDGLVTGVCPEAAESTWSLNIKRAILSSLQNSMPDFQVTHQTTETDVIGRCPVTYEPIRTSRNGYTVRKIKDVSSCSQPTQANTVFQTMSYDVPSKVKSLPLLKSTHECEQDVSMDGGRVAKSVCTERHIFRPFSRGDSGAITLVVQSLHFKGQSSLTTSRNQPVSLRTDLQYEHVEDSDTPENTQKETVATLLKICEMTQDGVRPETPGLFLDLVKGMRGADVSSLVSVGRQAKRLCSKAESLYHDAVPTLGTSAGVALMRNMIRGGEVTNDESDMWLTSLAFIPKPDVTMLHEVKALLTMESIRHKAYLAVSSLVNTYCRQKEDCENDVKEIVTVFKNNLGADCSGDRSVVLMSLKALGNTGQITQVMDVLNSCIVNERVSLDVRIAAINAMRRTTCNTDKTGLMELLQSTYADAELRINAYIILMQCPSEQLIAKIQKILESEEINQVGSFIWTHLTNLMESSSPIKKNIQGLLEDVKLKKAFNLDKRKYSRNIEWSAFSEAINAGVAVDSNLIWSSQSFVPHSGMVNLTIDLFGQSVNLVELGGRIQGLDAVLEGMFGEKKEGAAMTNDIVDNFDSTYRLPKAEPRGSYYIRIFGNEIRYDDFVGFEMQSMKEKLNYLQWLIELAKEHDIDFSKSMVFLESDLKVPTVSGMPLVLSVDGTATMDLKIKGKVDLRSIFNSPSELDILGTVRPSAAIEIKSRMGVDAFVAKTGLKMINTFHTSTLADGLIKLKDGKIFNLDINMPKERMDIFNAQSKFYVTYKGEDLEQRMDPEERVDIHRCISGSLVRAFGVELCADLSVPSLTKSTGPWFPLSGPVTIDLSLNKRDSFTKYHMEGRVIQQIISPGVFNNEIVFAFNTPGSVYDREFLASFILNRQEKAVKMDLRSPWKKLGLTGNMIDQENLKQITGKLSVDDVIQYSLITEVQINRGRYAMRYTPKLELTLPGRLPLKVSGSATYREDKKLDVDISVENVFKDPAIFKGLIRQIRENKKTRVETDMEVRVNSFKGQMSGFVDHLHTKDEIKTDTELTVRYRTDNGPQFFSLANQFHFETPARRKSLLMAGSLSSSLYSRLDTDFSINMVTEGNEAVLSVNMGLTNDKPKRITLDSQGKMDLTRNYRSAVVQGLAKINVMGNELEATFDHKHNPNELQTSCTGRLGSRKGSAEVSLNRQSVRPLNVAANAKITYLDHEITYSQRLVEQGNIYSHDMSIKVDQNEILSLSTSCKIGQPYEVTTDLTFFSWDPLHFEGLIQPDVGDFLAEAKYVYGTKSYSGELQWQHNGGYRNFANKGLLNLMMNGDKFSLQSDFNLKNMKIINVNIEGQLDIQNRNTRKVGFSGNCVLSRITPSLRTRVQWWPNHFLDSKFDMKMDNYGMWSPTRNLEGSFSFQSSFSENIKAAFKHDRIPDKVTTEGEISWAPTRKIDVAFGLQKNNGWSDAQVNLVLNTPFRQAMKLSSNIAYRLHGNQLTTNGQVGLDNKLTTFEFSGIADWKNSGLDLKATTPVDGYEDIALFVKNNHNGRLYASVIKLDVNSREIFGLEFNMEHESRGYFVTNSGSLSLNLPIRRYRTNKLTWSHDNNARNFNSRVVIEVRNEKLVLDFELKNRKAFSVKTKLLTPFIPGIYLSLEHQGDRQEHIYKTMVSGQYGDDMITLENDLACLRKLLTLKTRLTTPFEGYEEVILDISNALETKKFEGSYQLNIGAGREYSVSGTFVSNGLPAMTVDVAAKCPHTSEMSLSIATEKQGNVWESKINVLYLEDKSITFVGRLGLNDLKKLSIDITSPFEVMEKSSVDVEFQGYPRRFRSKAMLSHNMLRDHVEISAQTDLSDLTDISIVVAAKMPVLQTSSVNAVFRHRLNEDVYQTEVSLTLPGKQITASNVLQTSSVKAFNDRLKLQYGDDIMNVELQYNAEKDLFLSVKQQSPWFGEQAATLKHQGTWKNFKTSLSASLKPSEVIKAETQFFFNGNNVDVLLKITTPFHQLQIFEAVFNHNGMITDFENSLKVSYNSKMVLGRIRSDISNIRDMKIEITGETPLAAYNSVMCEVKHKVMGQTYRTDLSFISPSKELVATHSLEIKSDKIFTNKASLKCQEDNQIEVELKVDFEDSVAIDALLRTPWTGQQTTSIMHKGTWKNFQSTININPSQDDSVVGHAQFALSGNRVNSLGRITTSYPELRNFEIALTHHGSAYNFETEGKVDLNGQSKTAKLVTDVKNVDDMNLKLTATTPIHGLEVIDVSFVHQLSSGLYQTDLTSQMGQHKMAASNMLQFTSFKAFTTKTTLKYQEETITEVELNVDAVANIAVNGIFSSKWTGQQMTSLMHKGGWRNFETMVKISPRQSKELIFHAQSSLEVNSFSGQAKLTTPYSLVEIAEVNVNHQGRMKRFVNNLKVNLNGKQVEGQLSVNVADTSDLKLKLTATSPFSGLERINTHFTHKFTGHSCHSNFAADAQTLKITATNDLEIRNKANFKVKTTLTWMDTKDIVIDLNVNAERNVAIQAQVQNPWTGRQTLTVTHQGDLNNFQSMMNISPRDGDNIVSQAEFSHSGSQLNGHVKITTPYRELSMFEATLKHKGSIKLYETEMAMNLNGQESNSKLNANLENLNDMTITFTAVTPINGFEKTEVAFSHKMADQTFQSDLKMDVAGYKFTASDLLQVTSNKAFNIKTVVTFQDKPLAELELNVNMVRSIAFDASLRNKWSGEHTISLLHLGGWRHFETTLKVSPKQREMVILNTKASLRGSNFNALAKITTPYSSLQSFEVVISHKGIAQKFANSIMVDYNNNKLEGDLTLDLVNINNMEIKVTGKTPFIGYEFFNGVFQHQFAKRTYTTELALDAPLATIAASNMVQLRSGTSFKTETSLKWMKEETVYMDLDVIVARSVEVSGKFKSTWTGTQMASLTHQGSWDNFESSVTISPRESENVVVTSQFSMNGDRLSGTVTLTSPYAPLQTLEAHLSHQGAAAKFDTECYLHLNNKKNSVKLSTDFSNLNDLSLKASALTSLDGFKKTEVELTHTSSGPTYQSDLTLGLESQTYTASNTLSVSSIKAFSMTTLLKNPEKTMAEYQLNMNSVNHIAFMFRSIWSGEQMASIKHQGDWKNFETVVTLSPKQGDVLTFNAQASLQGYKFSGLTRFSTPYTALQVAEISVNHEGTIRKFANSISVKFNEEIMELELSSDMTNKDDLKIELGGITSFTGFKTVRGLIQHQFTGRVCKTEFLLEAPSMKVAASNMIQIRSSAAFKTMTSLNWMFDKTMDIELDVDVESDIALSGKLQSCWTGTQMASLTHQGPWSNFQTNLMVSPKETETVSASVQVSQQGSSFSGLLKILTPYSSMKNLEVTMTHQGFNRKFSSNVVITFNEENLEGELTADLTDLRDAKMQLTGRTSLGGLEIINGHFTHKVTQEHCETEFVLEVPSNKVAAQNIVEFKDTHFSWKPSMEWMERKSEMTVIIKTDNAFSLTAALSSPCIDDKSISFTTQGEWRNFEATVQISPRPGNDVETHVKFSMLDDIEASVSIVSSYSDWKLSKFNFRHAGTFWKFISELSMTYDEQEGKGNLSIDFSNCDDLKAVVSVETSFSGFESLTIDVKHKQTTQSCSTLFNFATSGSKLLASNVINMNNKRAVSTETSLECSLFGKTQLTMNIDTEDDLSIGAVFTSPWSGQRTLHFEQQGTWNKFHTQFSLASPSSQTVELDVEFSLEGYAVNGKAKLQTVFSVLRDFELLVAHQGDMFNFENEVKMKYNGKLSTGATRFSLQTAGFDASLAVATPFVSLKQISVTASHKGDLTAFNSKYELDYMGQKTVFTGVYNFRGSSVTGKFELTSPYDVIKTAGIEFSHRGDLTAFRNNGKFHLNERQYSSESTFSYRGNEIKCAASLHLQHDYSIELYHDGIPQRFGNNVTLRLDNEVITSRSDFVMSEGNIQTSVAVQTPFAGYRSLGLTFKHSGNLMNFQCDLNTNIGDEFITGQHIWKFENNAVHHSLTINTSFQGYSIMKYNLGHQERRGVIKQNVLLSIEGSKLEVQTAFKKTTNKITGNVNIRTPFSVASKMSVSFLHKVVDMHNFNNEVTATLNSKTIAFSSSFSKKNNMIEASFNIDTPFQTLSRVIGLLKHTGPLNGFSNEVTLTYDDTTLAASTSFRLQGDAISADVTVETPYRVARRLKLQVAHYGSGLTFNNNVTGIYNSYNLASMTSMVVEDGEIKTTVRLQTPFNGYKNLASGIHLRKEASAINSEIFVETGRKRTAVRQRLTLRDAQCEGSVALETPFRGYRNLGLRFKHVGSTNNFNNEATAYIEGNKVQGKTSFKILGSKVDMKLSLKTPLRGFTKAGATLNHDGYLHNFYNVISLNLEDQTLGSTSVLSIRGDMIAANVTLQTPFRVLQTLKYQLSHSGNLKQFDNEMSATYNTYTIRSTNKFVLQRNGLEAAFSVQTPFEGCSSMSLFLLHEGRLLPSKSQCVMKVEDKTLSLTHHVAYSDEKFDGSLLIESPFSGYERIECTVNHQGGARNFNNEFQVSLASSTVQGGSKFALASSGVDFEGNLATPFNGFTAIGAIFKQNGFSRNFNNELKAYIEDKAITSVNSLQLQKNTISADFKIETPFRGFSEIGFVVQQQGLSRNFNNQVKLYIERSVITSVNSLQFGERTISADFKVETPFEGFSKMGVTLNQQGLSRTFSSRVVLYIEDQAITSTNNLELDGRTISADFKITTPFEGFAVLGVVLKQRGLSRNFHNELKLYIEDEAITTINSLQVEGRTLSADFNIELPFETAKLLALKLTHSGNLKNFKNYMMVAYNSYKFENRNSFMLSRQKMDVNVAVDTPFRGLRNLGLSAKRNGLAADFSIEVSANKEDAVVHGQCTSKLTSSAYVMTTTLTGPFGNVAATFNHEGKWTNFKSEGSLQHNSNEYKINTEFQKEGYTVKLSTILTMPQTYGIVFEHAGPWTGFDNKLLVTLGDEPHIATSSFKYDGSVEANLKVESSQFPVVLTFSHGGHLKNFKQSSSLGVAGWRYGHTCELAFQGRKIIGLFSLNTSHKQLHTMSVTFNHRGRWTNFENQAALQLNGDNYSGNSQLLVGNKRVKGGIFLRIPEEYSLEIIQKGPKTDMTANVKLVTANKKSQMTTEFKTKNGIVDGAVDLRSPYIGGSINSAVNFNQNAGTLTASLKTPFENYQSFSAEVSHQGTPNDFKSAAKFETPFSLCHGISLELNHKGHRFNFATNGLLEIDSRRLSGDIIFVKNRQNTQAALNLRTPCAHLESASIKVNHRGVIKDFNSDVVVEWNDRKMEGALDFKMGKTIQTNARLATPFETVKQATFTYNHQGSLKDFTASSDISINGQTVMGTMSFNRRGTVLESSGSLTTPFEQMRQGTYQLNHRGYVDDFVTNGQIKFDGQVIEAEIINKLTPEIMTSARLSTSWTSLRHMKLSLNHRGHLTDFTTISNGELNGQVINGNLAFKMTHNKMESAASLQTPFEQFPEFAYTYTHDKQQQGVKATTTLTLPCQVYKNFRGEFDFSGNSQDFRSTLKVNTPFEPLPEGVLSVSHNGNLKAFNTACSLVIPSRNIESEITVQRTRTLRLATVKVSTPYRKLRDLYFETRNEKKGAEMVTLIEATFNGEKHFDADFTINTGDLTYASLNVHAPVNVEIKGRNKKRSKEMSFNIPSVISLTTSYQKEKGKFTQATNLQLGRDARNKFSYTVEGSAAITSNQALYKGKLNLDSRHGSFESSLKHAANRNSRQYVTEVQLQQLQLSSDITLQNSLKSIFKVSHPSLSKDIVFSMEGSMIDSYRCKLNLEYDDQKFEFIGKLADESPSHSDTKYIAEAHLTHPASHLDVQFSSQLTNNIEKIGGNMEVKYMMTRDRQLRANALRAEINKIREELNLEVDTPVKRVSMSGRRLAEGNGRHFAVSGTVDDRAMSADIQLTSDAPGFDVSLQLDSDNVILVSGKYEEPSSLHLEAFREESGRRIRQSEMSLKLSSDNLLSARFFLNPSIYNDMKRLFGFDLGVEKMVNDVWQSLQEDFRHKKMHLVRALQPLQSLWEEVTQPIVTLVAELYDSNDYYIRDVVDRVYYWSIVVNDQLASLRYRYSQNFALKYNAIKVMCYKSVDQVQDFLDSTVAPFAAYAYVKVMETLDYIHSHPALESTLNWLQSIDIEKHYANFKYYVVDVIVRYNAILDCVNNYWDKFNNIPGMSFAVRSVKAYTNALRWVYDVTELDRFVQALINELRTQGWHAIVNWWHSRCELVQPQMTLYNPEEGEFEVQMKMPVSWTEVTGLPELEIFKYWDKIKKMVTRNMPDVNKHNFSFANSWAFWDIFYAYKPSGNPLDWIPPFKSHAAVSGAQHIMTFDKRFYEFIGECSYLLARDFIDGKFSVLINYDNVNGVMTKKSLTVHSGDKELEILSNFKVKVDNRETDLPVVYRNTVIRRIGNIIQLDNDHGLTITCDLPHDRCTVKVTGWYYGKTGGLLGTYDNEPATDYHTADRRYVKSLEDFTLSWSAGSRCRAVNSATKVEAKTSSPEYQMCAKYFEKETSPFRICFGQIEPSSFMKMCMNEVARSTDKKAAVCRIGSFYVEECNMGYVPLRLPKDCVTCTTPAGIDMQEGETVTITKSDVPKAADVVFVVSHKSCNRDVTGKLGNIAQQLTRSFRQSGIRDVRFGLVGYGLSSVLLDPHTHTVDGEIFNASNKFKAAMEKFPTTDEATEEDSLAAIHFATNYPFRAGASKSIVLVPCDSCEELTMTYPEMQHLLQYHNIRLHVLLNHTFKLRTSTTKTAYIFGVDQNGLFTPRSVNDEALTGDQALRRQVSVPKDLCAALSQESNGSIFSITQLLQSRTVVQKKFTDVFTRLVAKKGAPSDCQICECVADPAGVGMNVCRSCAPVSKPWVEDLENEEPAVQKKKQARSIRVPRRKNKQRRRKA